MVPDMMGKGDILL